jgi:hypothetical protein
VGCGLLALNVYGMSRSLRSPLTAAEPSDFAHPEITGSYPILLILVGGIGVRLRPGRSLRRAQTL